MHRISIFNKIVCLMVFISTFNNISIISWRSALLVEETGRPGENHRPVASHWQASSHNVVHYLTRRRHIKPYSILQNKYSGVNYANNIKKALDALHSEVPKMFVNVVQIFDIAPIASMNGGFFCNLVHG